MFSDDQLTCVEQNAYRLKVKERHLNLLETKMNTTLLVMVLIILWIIR